MVEGGSGYGHEYGEKIEELIALSGADVSSFEGQLLRQQIETTLKLISDGHEVHQLKLITTALKEMRYAYRIFNENRGSPCVSIFGSARTPNDHGDYRVAEKFSILLAEEGWMTITGAAGGIMKAVTSGSAPDGSFGLSIRLPFETPVNKHIRDDPKLINFKYFFTRKLMFMSHADAVGVFPGGYGTMDELFEILTLMQTGKSKIVPVILLEGEEGVYWHHWEIYVKKNLLRNGWLSPEDLNLFHIAKTPEEGLLHIQQFYKRYHSYRYVKNKFVIRMLTTISEEQLEILNREYRQIVDYGKIELSSSLPEEDDHLELPRLVFHHTRRDFGVIRSLIDKINTF